jgi:hypothetical protein
LLCLKIFLLGILEYLVLYKKNSIRCFLGILEYYYLEGSLYGWNVVLE